MHKFATRDTVLLSGWLFADLLLGLMVIFLVSIPGLPPKIIPPPKLAVSPAVLEPSNPNCKPSGDDIYRCTVSLSETIDSIGDMTWESSNDMSPAITFSPGSGSFSPGHTAKITIDHIPCQTGSFTFKGSRSAQPVTVFWKCALSPVMLDLHYQVFHVHLSDIDGFLNGSSSVINDVKRQARTKIQALHHRVGLVIAYGGAPEVGDISRAQSISRKMYDVLLSLGRENFAPMKNATSYRELYNLNSSADDVEVHVFLFNR
uniref:Uncharacterized protein n=1 Tax=Thermosporothrix sp. COM3 TaxID=2490863 RepID=A0A455SJ60_9CHLR|nr:hypothetical protein KTC_17400 [Thermosporothrix sp. COM3]